MKHHYIDSQSKLNALLAHIQRSHRISLDIEADSLHHYFSKICLIQLSVDEENYIVDPLSKIEIDSLLCILNNKTLIIHGADFDLRMLFTQFNFDPRGSIFDTMLAAKLLGHRKASLSNLVKYYFDITLSKQGQKSDWSRRPLSEAQKEYAVKDTYYLGALAAQLESELERLNRTDWHTESCQWLVKTTKYEKKKDHDKEWRIKGWNKLDRKGLAMLREIWIWRDKEAIKTDKPSFKIMQNEKIIKLVQALERDSDIHESLKSVNLPSNCQGQRLNLLIEAIQNANDLPETEWPVIIKRKITRSHGAPRLKELISETKNVAKELNLEPSVIATRATLEALARNRPKTVEKMMNAAPIMRWQASLIEPIMKRLYIN